MITRTTRALPRALTTIGAALLIILGCGEAPVERQLGADTLTLSWPQAFGEATRPLVEFPHGEHSKALQAEGCKACHAVQADGRLGLKLKRAEDPTDDDALMEHYHAVCIGCHRQRAAKGAHTGPLLCGECHAERAPATVLRAPARLDLGLHARHVAAAEDKCEGCHHVYDEAAKKLVYKKGQEDACRDCHGDLDDGNKRSYRHVAHASCVGCHHTRAAAGEAAGPERCAGCHDPVAQTKWTRPADPPRLLRGQPDTIWLQAEGAKSGAVPFSHVKHERLTSSCSDCHHQSMKACKACHTLTGSVEGGHVTMEAAYHDAEHSQSCVGCHARAAADKNCAGCHAQLPAPPSQRGCVRCHHDRAALAASDAAQPAAVSGAVAHAPAAPTVAPREQAELPPMQQLAALPATGDDFPNEVRIDRLAKRYGPSTLPHAKIVARLDRGVRDSALAQRSHGATEVLCAGCHHHSPLGMRPPSCASCHEARAAELTDKPGLKAAYHRQCMGCHEQMGIKNGCTDCHAEVKR